jgi:hypothetical protein
MDSTRYSTTGEPLKRKMKTQFKTNQYTAKLASTATTVAKHKKKEKAKHRPTEQQRCRRSKVYWNIVWGEMSKWTAYNDFV